MFSIEFFGSRAQYLFTKDVAGILLNSGVKIFGGFVRDMMIHDHHAGAFYQKVDYFRRKSFGDEVVYDDEESDEPPTLEPALDYPDA